MSDRFSQYPPMIPTFNNNSNMLQQQQQPTQQQQGQQGQQQQQQQPQQQPQQPQQQGQQGHSQHQPQQDGHPNYPDQSRMWQPQIQYRPRSGMDISPPGQQQTPQMLRARLNAQNQQLGQQNPPQFTLAMNPPPPPPQMGGLTGPTNQPQQQPQPFPDPGSNPSTQPSHIPFPNMGSGINAAQRLGMQNSGPVNRQLELMLAQQTHNGGLFNAAKNQQVQQQSQQQQRDQQQSQQQQQQQQSPGINHPNADIFTSPALSGEALRRPSPSHPSNLTSQIQASMQGGGPQQQHPGVHHPGAPGMPLRRTAPPVNIQDITERVRATRQALANHESDLRQLMSTMQLAPSSELTSKARSLQTEIKAKHEMMNRLLHQQQLAMNNPGIVARANGISRVVPNMGAGQNPWAPQNSQFDLNGNIRPPQNGQLSIGGSQAVHPGHGGPNSMQPNPSLQTPTNIHGGLMAPTGVPRLGPSSNPPPQQLGSPFGGVQMNVGANKPSFLMGGLNIPGVPAATTRPMGGSGIGYPPPLDKTKIDTMLPGFLQKRNIKIDPGLLTYNDQQIDLARLHALVMLEGGYAKVNEKEMWNVIGGRMGFVNFPGSDREPPKSGPVPAQQIARTYGEYLLDLEQAYVRAWITNNSAMRVNPIGGGGGGTLGSGNHSVAPGSVGTGDLGGTGLPNGLGNLTVGQLQRLGPMLMQYANLNVAELRQKNLSESAITLVERYRPQLQRMVIESKKFSQQVRMNGRNAPGMVAGPTPVPLHVDANGMQQHPNQGPSGAGVTGLGPGPGPNSMINDQQSGGAGVGAGGIGMGVHGGLNGVQAQQMMRQQQMTRQQLTSATTGDGKIGVFSNNFVLSNPGWAKRAMDIVTQFREDLKKGPAIMRLWHANVEVPFEQQADFKQLLQTLGRSVVELNDKVYLICMLLPGATQRTISLIHMVHLQRQLMAASQPRYIMTLDNLQHLAGEAQKILSMFSQQENLVAAKMQQQLHRVQEQAQVHAAAAAAQQQPGQPQHLQQSPHPPQILGQLAYSHPNGPHPLPPSAMQVNGSAQSPPNMIQHQSHSPQPLSQQSQPSAMGMPPQPGYSTQSAPSPSHRAASINLQPPPSKRKPVNAPTPSNAAPSPVGVSTPAPTNAPTPNATINSASPSAAPKSPKGKVSAKSKQVKRKASTATTPQNQNANVNASVGSSSHPTPNAPSVPIAPQVTQAPETMQQQGSSGLNGSTKRAREEDGGSGSNVAPSPLGDSIAVVDQPSPPKRVKMEWDGPPSEEMQQRKAMVESVKTEEDTTQFLAQMSELFKMAGSDSHQASDFNDLTSVILKGVNQVPGMGSYLPDNGDGSGVVDVFGAAVTSLDQSLLAGGIKDDLEQYFDFARLGGEDDDSKTPELVSSSSTTNTSPGSNSGHESNTETVGVSAVSTLTTNNEVKSEESMDLTYLGLWKELDGGESASYQSNDWKWDSTMTSLDLPWSICNPNMS